jgi:hypothetical protein
MSDFDIGTLLEFKPPKFLCKKCRSLLYKAAMDWKKRLSWCPVCKVKYVPKDTYEFFQVENYLRDHNKGSNYIEFKDAVAHGQKLAAIAYHFSKDNEWYPPMRAFFEALSIAEKFIHFVTYGLSHSFYGALKLKSQLIPVRGVAANIHPEFAEEINSHHPEAPNLNIKIFEQRQINIDWESIPHQKLIVIDGLMAFKGAANMTNSGWRKAARGRDHIEIVTNIQEVVELHNKLFSPIWSEFSTIEQSVEMSLEDDIPF